MHQHIFSHPNVIQIEHPTLITVRLLDNIDDLLVLASLTNPLFEMIVSQVAGVEATLIVRQQAFVNIDYQPTHCIAEQYDVNRLIGQGVRLYSRMAVAPRVCIEQLKAGIEIIIQADGKMFFSAVEQGKFELIPLEHDLRLLCEPQVLVVAKTILGQKPKHSESTAALAVHISELEQVRRDIAGYMRGESGKIHPGVSTELLKLDHLLQNKRQWLLRTYHQSLERPSLSRAANEASLDIEKLQQKLECYNILAPFDVTELVNQLSDDEN
ncbi:hypothetical protein ACRWQM_10130 [Shewanella sp. HL-SH5]|uniref:hypothetical protein n=1 Tax=Shewanella sp. HL-SH5 TaxID=3436241 RepID=UPI003EC05589